MRRGTKGVISHPRIIRSRKYIGFTPREKAEIEKIFEADPRLKLKRDKTISNIKKVKVDNLNDMFNATYGGGGDENEISLSEMYVRKTYPKSFNILKKPHFSPTILKRVLAHEIQHGIQERKLGTPEFNREFDAGTELAEIKQENPNVAPFGSSKHFSISLMPSYHETTPFEANAYVEAAKTVGKKKGYVPFNKNLKIMPALQFEKALFEEGMRTGPKLKALPQVWKE
jgi:hypothetical protein